MLIDNKFNIGQAVYVVTDPDQYIGIVNCLRICPSNLIIYVVAQGAKTSDFYDFELSTEPNMVLKTS